MNAQEFHDALVKNRLDSENITLTSVELPDGRPTYDNVTLRKDTLRQFNRHYRTVCQFAAMVCGVDAEDLTTMDMVKYLYERERYEDGNDLFHERDRFASTRKNKEEGGE